VGWAPEGDRLQSWGQSLACESFEHSAVLREEGVVERIPFADFKIPKSEFVVGI